MTAQLPNAAQSHAPLRGTQRLGAYLPLAILPVVVFWIARDWPAWVFMWCLAIAIFAGLKWLTFIDGAARVESYSSRRAMGYLFAWPGLNAERFLGTGCLAPVRHREWVLAVVKTFAGVFVFGLAVVGVGEWPDLLVGWLGMIGVVLTLHFGLFHLLSLGWRTLGVDAPPLMNRPLAATSLADFWGRRWNVAFRDVSFRFLYGPLFRHIGHNGATLVVFAVSGLIHDMVISIPAGAGYGWPTLYFLLQALGLLVEQSRRGRGIGLGKGIPGRVFFLSVVVIPLPLLFHRSFVDNVILPMLSDVGRAGTTMYEFLNGQL